MTILLALLALLVAGYASVVPAPQPAPEPAS